MLINNIILYKKYHIFFSKLKFYFKKIEFWLIIFFLVRLIGITNPPLEISHNWRQVTGLMVARNFLEENPNIFYPRVDETKGKSGIIGMEFPSLNYLHFLLSKIFGYTHWYGRLINLIVSSLGIYFFYKILVYHLSIDKKWATISSLILIVSIWFSFSRKMMPDTYCLSLMFIGLYFGLKFLSEAKPFQLFLFFTLSTLGFLSKIHAGIYFTFILLSTFNKKYKLNNSILILFFSIFSILITFTWYFLWNNYLSEKYGNWYNIGKPISVGFTEISTNLIKTLDNFYFDAFQGYIFFVFFLIGWLLLLLKKEKKIIIIFSFLFMVFLIYIFKSGFFFYHHNYYIIPFVPAMSVIAAYPLYLLKNNRINLIFIIIGTIESIANQQHDFFIKKSEKYKLTIESIMDSISDKNSLIAINDNGNPQLLYLAHRKGWIYSNEQLYDYEFINNIINENCQYIVVNKHLLHINENHLNYLIKKIFENNDFIVFKAIRNNPKTVIKK